MKMKRRISICIIVFTVLISAAIFWANTDSDTPQESQIGQSVPDTRDTEQTTAVNTGHTIPYPYLLKDLDGNVVLYCDNSSQNFMETGIRSADLPMDPQQRLKNGIGFESQEELFDFLESYSS